MSMQRKSRGGFGPLVWPVVLAVLALAAAACSGGGGTTPSSGGSQSPGGSPGGSAGSGTPASSAVGSSPSGGAPTKLAVGLGYIPSVQFAQFYRAQQAGYYRDAGLDVSFQNKIDPQLITLVGQGAIDIGIADGTSVIPAVSQGIPVRYVATVYAKFPNIVFAKASSGITKPADLKGKRVGTPGTFGSSWIMLQALLSKANLTTSDITVQTYPDFTQAAAVAKGQADAATGFVNNEPIQLKQQGIDTSILRVDDVVPLPGNGLIVGTKTLAEKHDALAAFVAATLKAQDEIAANPSVGLDAAIAAVPELGTDRATQEAILAATIDTWSSPYTQAHGSGAIDTAAWTASIRFMQSLPGGLVPNPVTADQIVTSELLPAR
ncbi:MAG TPA: ABC transporter substrate-binding protein [Candidatus Limnocylindrales bacterium]|nr:ABC transporter substrate-binding protein [Candidatus Limnocylindrales bacterium]